MNAKTNQETEKPAAKRRRRWWIPMTIVALAVANVARIRGSAELESNFKNMPAGRLCAQDQKDLLQSPRPPRCLTSEEIFNLTKIDRWFLTQIQKTVRV